MVKCIWDTKPGQQSQHCHPEPKNSKSKVLSLDTFLFTPIVQMGPLRLQEEIYAKGLVRGTNQVIWPQSTCSHHVLLCLHTG